MGRQSQNEREKSEINKGWKIERRRERDKNKIEEEKGRKERKRMGGKETRNRKK